MNSIPGLFVNSSCLFIEYDDIIKSPLLTMMDINKNNEKLCSLVNMNDIYTLSGAGMYEWYKERKDFNVLKSLDTMNVHSIDGLNSVIEKIINSNIQYTEASPLLEFKNALTALFQYKFETPIYLWSRYNNIFIANDIDKLYPSRNIKIRTGNLEKVIAELPADTTYVFADIEHVKTLYDMNRLNLVTITIAKDYRYNFSAEDRTKPKIDIEAMIDKNHIFKFRWMVASKLNPAELEETIHRLTPKG